MNSRNNFADRLLTIRNHLRMNQDDFAKKIRISQGYLAKVENGTHIFSRKVINRIANEFEVSVAWLETGEGQAPFMQKRELEEGDNKGYPGIQMGRESEYFLIPLYPQKSGEGNISEKGLYVKIMPLKSWVQNALQVNPDNLSMLLVEGESMSPTFHPGDILIIDQSRGKDHLEEGFYLIILNGGSPLLKRLQPMLGGKIKIISDNPRYESMTVSLEESDEIRIVGRIIWQARRI
jgi:phage repressor protein C with HTH and peptisase S24 domain